MKKTNAPVILHIPHSSKTIPAAYRHDFVLSDTELEQELLQMTDAYTDILFPDGFQRVVFPLSRLVCDPERFENDSDEAMSTVGMGCVYTHGSHGQLVRPSPDREAIISEYYRPHHELLTSLADELLSTFRQCLIIDCHSFSPMPLPYELDKTFPRPDICIGTDQWHTPDHLRERCVQYFKAKGYTVALNTPYSGALVPIKHYGKDKRVSAIMVEVNRSLYMDSTGAKTDRFSALQKVLADFVEELVL